MDKRMRELNKIMTEGNITSRYKVPIFATLLVAEYSNIDKDLLDGKNDGGVIYNQVMKFVKTITSDKEKILLLSDFYNCVNDDLLWGKSETNKEDSVIKKSLNHITGKLKEFTEDKSIDLIGQYYARYATFDGKDNGIVLTPQYLTELMAELIGVDEKSKVIDLCTGTGGFIIAANKVGDYKLNKNLYSVEFDLNMWCLNVSNMIIRGINIDNAIKGSAFEIKNKKELKEQKINKALLNPPYSYDENGMPFVIEALDLIEDKGLVAIVIQDSAGSGKAINSNKKILNSSTLKASIKLPNDIFQPGAAVATSIYIIEKGTPHDYNKNVRFIDFRNDGYKRTKRSTRKIDNPEQKYKDIVTVFKTGKSINDIVCVDDKITKSFNDWNYEKHEVYDTTPTEDDFLKTVGDYMMFQVSNKELI